jgi:hypothetical protein
VTKSALKSSSALARGHWGRGRRTVQFQGSAQKALINSVAHLSRLCRAGCVVAGFWESFIAVVLTFDFMMIPLNFVVEAVLEAKRTREDEPGHVAVSQPNASTVLFTISISLDFVFVLNIAFRVAQVLCPWHKRVSFALFIHA